MNISCSSTRNDQRIRLVILLRSNIAKSMLHNLFIDSDPEAETRHRFSGLPLTFSRKETLQ